MATPLTFGNIIGGVLLYCGNPSEKVLPRGFICEYGLDKITFYMTELNMTDENWLLMRQPLNANPGQSDYSLGSFPSFGRPVLIETKDESNPYHVRREIDIIDFQDRKLLYDGPSGEVAASYSYPHNARSASFYIRDGVKRVAFDPSASVAATYTVYYEPDRLVPEALTDSAFPLEQFGGLLKASIAKPCLAHCGYDDSKYARLDEAISAEITDYRRQFDTYIKQDSQPKSAIARGFMTDDWGAWEY